MRTCNGCKYADWKRTNAGRLHPSGDGKCTYEWKTPQLAQSMYFASFEPPMVIVVSISRKRELPDHCAYFVRV